MAKNIKVSLLFSTILISFLLPACSETYRYECQDPKNWEAPECNPPLCLVDNMCTDILIGVAPTNVTQESEQESQQDVEQDSTPSECPSE